MWIYIIVFIISIFYISIGISDNNKNDHGRKIFLFLGLLLPCLLASFRSINVGTDTSGYIYNLYDLASKKDGFLNFCNLSTIYFQISDYAYLFITYLSAKVFGSFRTLLFLIELLIILPIFCSLNINKYNKKDVILGMIVFFLFMYNVTFNMARQSIAISFSILGLSYLIKNKNMKSLICLILAILFHSTALLVVFIYLIYKIFTKIKKKSNQSLFIIGVYILSILIVFSYKNIIYFLYNHGIYEHGILYIKLFNNFDFSFTDTFVYFLMIVMIVLNKKNLIEKNIDYRFYLFLAIESMIILQLGAFVQYMERVSFFLFYPLLINGISMIGIKDNKITKNVAILVLFFVIYWIYTFVILNSHNTIPYNFG